MCSIQCLKYLFVSAKKACEYVKHVKHVWYEIITDSWGIYGIAYQVTYETANDDSFLSTAHSTYAIVSNDIMTS